ncbi:MAG: PAS domain S-box protein, partial [Pseudobdellovibrionaceae bacterium]|nr:PAS domain S-box protein [Pseudobdellovibrionaceae bacterium]
MLHPKAEHIQYEIIQRLGFLPPFFEPAYNAPVVLRNLWQQTLDAYLDNPLPDLFKEKLAVVLSRYCTVPYCMLCHSSTLRPLGMSATAILELLEMPALGFIELSEKTAWLAQQTLAEDEWPEPETELEECILACCVAVFLHQDSEHCMRQLRTLLGPDRYPYLVLFLGYIRTCLNWAEAHPELSFEADQRVQKHLGPLIQDEPGLRDFFANYQSRITMQADRRTQWLTQQYHTLLETEHKVRAESDEQASRMKSLLDSTFEGIWGLDLEGRITFVNAAAVKALGYQSADELIGKNAHDLVHSKYPDGTSYPKEDCPVLKALNNGTSVHLENEVLWREDGTSFFTLYRSSPIKQDGQIVGAVSTFVDNTERRNILEQLINSQEWLSATLKSIGDAVIATSADDEPKIVFMNDVAEKLTGWTLEEVKGLPVAQAFVIMDSRTREQATSPMGRALAEGIKFELADPMTLLSRTGEEFMIEHSVAPIRNIKGDVSGVALVFRDVTAKAQAESREIRLHQDVRHAQEMLAGFFAQSPVPMVIFLGPEHEFSLVNPPYVEFIGRNPLGRKIRDVLSADEGGEYFALLDDVYRTGIPYIGSELPYKRPDKNGILHDMFIQILYQPFREPDGTVKGILALVIDQTEQVLARKRIEDSEGKLKTLAEELLTTQSNLQSALESCRMGSWYVELSQNHVSYSTAAQTILGIESLVTDPNEFVARYVHPDDRDTGHEALRKAIAERCPYHYEFRLYQPSGAMLWIMSRGKLLVGADGQPYALTGIIIDITEARLTEAKLRESELRYRTLFESVDQGVCLFEMIFDDDNRPIDYHFLEINPTFEAQTGLVHAQGKRARELVPDLDNFWFETYGRVALTGESIRFEQPAPAMGRIFDVYAVRVGEAEEHRVALLFSDITERKKQEKNLKDSEARFRTITEVMPQIVWSALPDGTINYLNQKWSEFSGIPLHTSLEGGWIDSIHADDHAKASQIWLQSLTSGDMYETEFRMKHHSGQYRWGLM